MKTENKKLKLIKELVIKNLNGPTVCCRTTVAL